MTQYLSAVRNKIDSCHPAYWDPQGNAVKLVALIPFVNNIFGSYVSNAYEIKLKTKDANVLIEKRYQLLETISKYQLVSAVAILAYLFLFTALSDKVLGCLTIAYAFSVISNSLKASNADEAYRPIEDARSQRPDKSLDVKDQNKL